MTDSNGTVTGSFEHVLATRQDGSVLRKVTGPLGTPIENSLRIIEFTSKLHVEIRDLWELKSSRSVRRPPPLRQPSLLCLYSPNSAQEAVVGQESVSGYQAVRVTRGRRTSWYALECGCALVRERMEFASGEVSEKTLIALTKGDPEKALFHSPDSYKEVPPSQIALRSAGVPGDEQLQKLDQAYFDNRPTK